MPHISAASRVSKQSPGLALATGVSESTGHGSSVALEEVGEILSTAYRAQGRREFLDTCEKLQNE